MKRIYPRKLPQLDAAELQKLQKKWSSSSFRKKKEKKKWSEGVWRGKYRVYLHRQYCGICAYCEALTAAGTNGAVEHFLPKDIHHDRKFDYENWVFACQHCNSAKGTSDPSVDPWIDPRRHNPPTYLLVLPTGHLGPAGAHAGGRWKRGDHTIHGADLNCERTKRPAQLVDTRQAEFSVLQKLVAACMRATSQGSVELAADIEEVILTECTDPRLPFSGVRLCALRMWEEAGTSPLGLYARALTLRRKRSPSAQAVFL